MLEAYLFVDPLCKNCIQSEKVLLKISKEIDHLSFQFVPMLNIKILNSNLNPNYKVHYHVVMDYKAALFQGKRRGRAFFMMLQNELLNDNKSYTNHLVFATAENAKLDLDMFKEDRHSKLAKNAFKSDQKLANEMNITKPSSAVIFNWDSYNYGVLFNNIDYEQLLKICCSKHNKHRIFGKNNIPVPDIHLTI